MHSYNQNVRLAIEIASNEVLSMEITFFIKEIVHFYSYIATVFRTRGGHDFDLIVSFLTLCGSTLTVTYVQPTFP